MKGTRLVYFALGVLSVVSLGAFTNQVDPRAPAAGLALDNTGITFPDGTVQTTAAAPRDPRRAFYLTENHYGGIAADNPATCGSGFHFASLWEIIDVSNLRYATDIEGHNNVERRDDSGQGPPTGVAASGWIRTGHSSGASTGDPLGDPLGQMNCNAWASASSNDHGATVWLGTDWLAPTGMINDPPVVIAPWFAAPQVCSADLTSVWCVEDYPGAASS